MRHLAFCAAMLTCCGGGGTKGGAEYPQVGRGCCECLTGVKDCADVKACDEYTTLTTYCFCVTTLCHDACSDEEVTESC